MSTNNAEKCDLIPQFDPSERPMVEGGVSLEKNDLKKNGWKSGTIKYPYRATIIMRAPEVPGGVLFAERILPTGTSFLYHETYDMVIMEGCGNGSPVGWRDLCRAGFC